MQIFLESLGLLLLIGGLVFLFWGDPDVMDALIEYTRQELVLQ